ncbi:GAF domain-containing protein [Streptomyces sp. NPDC003077]|uniref:sensor histidine kinase n=1 Tax=Streptomyces sp. NPDC003077 TaxID=3154443 RepID=UPI0033B6D80C
MSDATGGTPPPPLPSLPQLRLDELLEELQARLDTARTVQSRMHGLLEAVLGVGRTLELSTVLRRIVEAAVVLADAEYGALGIVESGVRLSDFLPVGISERDAARIGPLPSGHGILGELIRHPEPLRLADLTQHPASHGFPPHHPPMRTFLGVPIRVREEVFGNLYLTEKRGGVPFDADDEAVLTTLAVAAGVAIDNARLYRESVRRERRLEALGEITRALLTGRGAQEVLDLIADRAREVMEADASAVLLPTGDGETLVVKAAHGQDAAAVTGTAVPAHGSLAGLAARTGQPAVSADVRSDPRAHALPGPRAHQGPVIAVPLPVDERASGALRLSRSAGRTPFTDAEVELLSGFAAQATLALELGRHRAESEKLALLDDRDRIARDLHDLAIQRLFATGMTLQSAGRLIDRPEAADRVGRAVDDLDETIKIIRTTIFALRTEHDRTDAPPTVRRRVLDVVTTAAESLGFMPSLRMDGPVDTDVPEEVADHLLAVLTEALSNIARHADARRVDVALDVGEETVLSVTDDGVGLSGAPGGGGLDNMRSRAALLGGTFELTVPTAGGTGVVWRVPTTRAQTNRRTGPGRAAPPPQGRPDRKPPTSRQETAVPPPEREGRPDAASGHGEDRPREP